MRFASTACGKREKQWNNSEKIELKKCHNMEYKYIVHDKKTFLLTVELVYTSYDLQDMLTISTYI